MPEAEADAAQMALTFTLAGETFALPVKHVSEIIDPLPVTRAPNADPFAPGLVNVRGTIGLLHEDAGERTAFAEALTTHTTSFFRERAQFDWLSEQGLPELAASGARAGRNLVIWSAACSTGQEGWTALIVAQQGRREGRWPFEARLVGTDLSRAVLQSAKAAVYDRSQVEGIPSELRPRVLLSSRNGDGRCRIAPDLRARADWRQANLATGEGLDGLSADVAFLRNVLIYFDEEVRARVLDNVFRRLRPGGFLLVGHTEAGHARREGLEVVRPSIYRRVG